MTAGLAEGPHPRMVHVWALKVYLIPLLLWTPVFLLFALSPIADGPRNTPALLATLAVAAAFVLAGYAWANLYRRHYRWQVGSEEVIIWSGILFRKRVTIPYARIQNVNVVRGPLLLLFGLSGVEVETAGQKGSYYGSYTSEGYLPGTAEGESLADAIIEKVRAGGGSGGL